MQLISHDELAERSDYISSLNKFIETMNVCNKISHQFSAIQSPTGLHYWASVLFTALVTKSFSFGCILPHNPWAVSKIDHWDYGTCAVLARTILEHRLTFHYFCIDPCSQEEWECRWNIFNLHDCNRRLKIFAENGKEYSFFAKAREDLHKRLHENIFFISLNDKQQKEFLKTKTPFLYHLKEISQRAELDSSFFDFMYPFLSSHTHCLPFAFYRIGEGDDGRGRGVYTSVEKGYTIFILDFVVSLLDAANEEYASIW